MRLQIGRETLFSSRYLDPKLDTVKEVWVRTESPSGATA
jgi:hypothetical protein